MIYTCVDPPTCYSAPPHQRMNTIFPKNLCQVQNQFGWITQKISPLVHSSFPWSLSTDTSAQPKVCGASSTPCKAGPGFLRPPQFLQCSNPTLLEIENCPQSRKKKALLQEWDGTLWDSEVQSENVSPLYTSSKELSCHISSDMPPSSCFLSTTKRNKNPSNISSSSAVMRRFARGFNATRGS